jgi:hypothetical protein
VIVHPAISAERFAEQMATFDRMREIAFRVSRALEVAPRLSRATRERDTPLALDGLLEDFS